MSTKMKLIKASLEHINFVTGVLLMELSETRGDEVFLNEILRQLDVSKEVVTDLINENK